MCWFSQSKQIEAIIPKQKFQASHKDQKKAQPSPQHCKSPKVLALDSMDSQEATFEVCRVSRAQSIERETCRQASISLCVCENYDPCCAIFLCVCANTNAKYCFVVFCGGAQHFLSSSISVNWCVCTLYHTTFSS
jgi:hypothetical protein